MSAAEARSALEEARQHQLKGHDFDANQSIALAQVHATLALVDEQRTANLIAALERDAIQPPHESTAANRPFWNALAADITERLGLA
jgi:hypothetical protein